MNNQVNNKRRSKDCDEKTLKEDEQEKDDVCEINNETELNANSSVPYK